MGSDFCNENGLVDGRIPSGKDCPFKDECEIAIGGFCKRPLVMESNFSCASARGFSIIKSRESFKDSEKVLIGM